MNTSLRSPVKPGDSIHFLAAMTVPVRGGIAPEGAALARGSVLTVTSAIVEAGRDRNGNSWLDLVDDVDGQAARWGQKMFARGPWPDGAEPWTPGAPDWFEAREQARRAAWAIVNPDERQAALRNVERRYGAAPTTSTTHGVLDGGRGTE
jgi:hypothetical protein